MRNFPDNKHVIWNEEQMGDMRRNLEEHVTNGCFSEVVDWDAVSVKVTGTSEIDLQKFSPEYGIDKGAFDQFMSSFYAYILEACTFNLKDTHKIKVTFDQEYNIIVHLNKLFSNSIEKTVFETAKIYKDFVCFDDDHDELFAKEFKEFLRDVWCDG